jgi:6-phosphogluconate dehydrogenase
MTTNEGELGMIGLGVMGRNLLLNMSDHGHSTAGYDKDPAKVETLREEASQRPVHGAESMKDLVAALHRPRTLMMLVPAGNAVDAVIDDALPHLERGDLLIDAGNSHFSDTDRRAGVLSESGVHYLGVGVSGGEHGARHGPSIMPGGDREAYARVQSILEDVAAHVGGEPCVTYLGPGSAGHYVKMVHNGIEYGLMQLIAETYDFMRRGLGLNEDELHAVYKRWNQGPLNGFLIEITADIFKKTDGKTGRHLVSVILDQARQKGTGMWTSQDAMELQTPVPTIDAAVGARDLSGLGEQRQAASKAITGPEPGLRDDAKRWTERLEDALQAAMIITYAQGLALLSTAAQRYEYDLRLEEVARIWRGGCIIRAARLEDIRAAYRTRPDLKNLLLDPHLGGEVAARQENLRSVVARMAQSGIPAPALMASLSYLDGYRSEWLPANLIQAQRDYFGAHTYQRVDMDGTFHTQWSSR